MSGVDLKRSEIFFLTRDQMSLKVTIIKMTPMFLRRRSLLPLLFMWLWLLQAELNIQMPLEFPGVCFELHCERFSPGS